MTEVRFALQADDRIVAAGRRGGIFHPFITPTSNSRNGDVAIARWTANGGADTTLAGSGLASNEFGLDEGTSDIALASDGAVVVAGWQAQGTAVSGRIVRFLGAGQTIVTLAKTSGLFDYGTYGQAASFTATVAGAASAGTVQFRDGDRLLDDCGSAGAVAVVSGAASCTTTQLAPGLRPVRAFFSGDGTIPPAHSVPLAVVVNGSTGDEDGDDIPDFVEGFVGRDPLAKDNDVFGDSRLFAMQQYRDFLRREGDVTGVEYYRYRLACCTQRAAAIDHAFLGSPEFDSYVAPVARLYFAVFLRYPDYAGLEYWTDYFRAGHQLAEIAGLFAASPEFQATYGSLDNGSFLTLLYRNVMGREPDANGYSFWLNQLDTNQRTRGQLVGVFSESPEFRALSRPRVYVTMAFAGMLRRAPDAAGFDFWVDYMEAGNSGVALIDGFLAAPEYRARFLP